MFGFCSNLYVYGEILAMVEVAISEWCSRLESKSVINQLVH